MWSCPIDLDGSTRLGVYIGDIEPKDSLRSVKISPEEFIARLNGLCEQVQIDLDVYEDGSVVLELGTDTVIPWKLSTILGADPKLISIYKDYN